MTQVTKIAPRREGQEKDLHRLEERMHILIGEIAECDRVIRLAREAEEKIEGLRKELAGITEEYSSFAIEERGA
jgi:hypothetical protein